MGNSQKKSIPVARQQVAPLTPEQKQEAMVRFFTQKRESIATGILFNLMQNPVLLNSDVTPEATAELAIEIADRMIEKLYPLKEE